MIAAVVLCAVVLVFSSCTPKKVAQTEPTPVKEKPAEPVARPPEGLVILLSVTDAAERDNAMEVIRRRVELAKLRDVDIIGRGDTNIEVTAPAGTTGLKELLMQPGTLEFRLEVPESEYEKYETANQAAMAAINPLEELPPPQPGVMLEQGKDSEGKPITGLNNRNYLLLYEKAAFDARDFADFGLTTEKGKPAVRFTVTASAAARFEEATQSLTDEKESAYGKEHGRLAIFVNGTFESAPVVLSRICDNGVITFNGEDRDKRVKNLLITLKAGALHTTLKVVSETTK
jgi:preprotein translocase subunit SecD